MLENAQALDEEADDRSFDVLGPGDRLGETSLDDTGGGRSARDDAHILPAEHPPEPADQALTEAGRQRGTRPLAQMPDGLETGPREGEGRLERRPQSPDGQAPHGFRFQPRRHDPDPAKAGERTRAIGSPRDRRADAHAEPLQTGDDVGPHRCFPIEEMRAARDVEDEPVWRVQRHARGPAIARVGKALQEQSVGCWIDTGDGDPRDAGPSVGERQSRHEAELEGTRIDGREPQRAFDLLDENERVLIRLDGASLPPGPPLPVG